jgi:4-hydroxy-tetrahydrodipicolinate synthase
MLSENRFRGVFTALVTPMDEGGAIDWECLARLVEEQVKAGIDGLVPVGTTGESPTLDNDEHIEVIRAVVKAAAGRVPVIAGTGSNSTAEALHLTREADIAGADAFLQVAPYYNKPGEEGLFRHFEKIANSTGKPVMLYSIPGRCGIEISVETVARLAKACPNIRTIKEAGGDARRVTALRQACPEVTVLSGDDGLVPEFVEAGAQGVVSVASNLEPAAVKELTAACLAGDGEAAGTLYKKWQPLLTDLVFMDGNPVTIKEVLFQAGRIPSPSLRLPLVRTSGSNQARIRDLLQSLNLLPA